MSSVAWIRTLQFRAAAAATAAVLAAALGGCTAAPEPPEQPSSIARLEEALEEFGNAMLDDGAPAVVMQAKVRGEERVRAFGVTSLESREPVETTDQVPIASVTEAFVAVSVLKLVSEGRLGLEDEVSRHLPEFEGIMHPPGPVTVRQLLQHRSGMPDYMMPLLQQASLGDVLATGRSHREFLALAATQPWKRRLAQGFEHSASNYVVLGMIVERLRGRTIGEVLRSDIIEPLGLRSTSMTGSGPTPPALVHGYVTSLGERLDVSYAPLHAGDPAGGLVSSVGDLNVFFAALLQGRLIPQALVRTCRTSATRSTAWASSAGTIPAPTTSTTAMPARSPVHISMSSADGTRQASFALASPPKPFSSTGNGIADDLTDVVKEALNASC